MSESKTTRQITTEQSLMLALERLEHRLAETMFEVDAFKTALKELKDEQN